MAVQHESLAAGRWQAFSLVEQLGHIGSEVGRARKWREKDEKRVEGAACRALELMDLTIRDPRWRGRRRRELSRAREVFCGAIWGDETYGTTLADLERYFNFFAVAARRLTETRLTT